MAIWGGGGGGGSIIEITRSDCKYPVYIRNGTTDKYVYEHIFLEKEYAIKTKRSPKTIVDAGANIGLASVYFANQFPESQIIAIEPECGNYELLKKNVENYKNIIPLNNALWNTSEEIDLLDTGLGEEGFMVTTKDEHHITKTPKHNLKNKIKGITIDEIMKNYNFDSIDILKIDIEGSEREVFECSDGWINKVNAIIIELHERMKDGCCRVFYNKTNGFSEEWAVGDSSFLARNGFMEKA
ncbi:MAG: FkbM family methyltransferase [Treponematales bacterium]